uniref:PDZ domain-containing protein n=1 Tax=Mesocestoides corti TaxID=53468 RepID=A0A5K3F3U7_MESCO
MSTGALPTSELGSEVSTVFVPRGPIGFEFSVKTQGSVIVISQVRQGGTAERAGLKCGSILRAVNRQPIDGLTFLQVSNMIRRTSGLITEISVVEPREPEDRNTRDGLLTSVPTKFDATPSTAPDKSASQDSTTPTSGNNGRASAVQNEPTPDSPQLLSLLPVHYSPSPLQFTETSTARDGKTAPPRPQFRTRPAVSGTSPRAGLTGSRELRRQAILLPNDAVCVREQSSDPVKFTKPNFFSFRQPRLQHGVSEGTTRVDDAPQQPDNSFFGAADTSPPSPSEEVIPSLVRRQAYSSLSMRRRGAKVEDGGPRFLPAHPLATPAALPPRDNSLSFTFLPKHTPGHQAFATGGQLEASSPAFVDSTKKKSDLSDKVRNQLQRHNSASGE